MSKARKFYIIFSISLFVIITTLTITSFYQQQKKINKPIFLVGEEPVTQAEYAFYYTTVLNGFYSNYSSYLDVMNINFEEDLELQECYFEGYSNWQDFFSKTTLTAIQEKKAVYKESQLNNFEYDYTDLYKTFKKQIQEKAIENNTSVKNMYENIYGKYVTEKIIKKYFIEYYTATAYESEISSKIEITDNEINEMYEAQKDFYDYVTYRVFELKSNLTDEMTESEKNKKILETEKLAKEFFEKVYDEETYENLCKEYDSEYIENSSLHEKETYYNVNSIYRDWLFDCTEEKQTTYIKNENTGNFYIVYFINRDRMETTSACIRHVLIPPDTSTSFIPSEEDYKKAKDSIKEILKEFELTNRTEDDFINIAKKYSKDTGTSANGGLMANYSKGYFGKDLDSWIFDKEREKGDYTIAKSNYGYHIVYFVKLGEEDWRTNIRLEITNKKYEDILKELLEKYPVKQL